MFLSHYLSSLWLIKTYHTCGFGFLKKLIVCSLNLFGLSIPRIRLYAMAVMVQGHFSIFQVHKHIKSEST